MKLHYIVHSESDDVFIDEWDNRNADLGCDELGVVKERTLSEFKKYLSVDSWILKIYTDQELIEKLGLKEEKDYVYVYTDGSCNNKTKANGGCGIVLKYKEYEKQISLGQWIQTTSARMEIRGVLEALRLIINKTFPVKLYCDNQYVVNAIAKEWVFKWEKEGWIDRNSNFPQTKRVNYDLWIQVLEEYRKFPAGNVEFIWVKGHNGHIENEICDQLASQGGKCENITIDRENLSI